MFMIGIVNGCFYCLACDPKMMPTFPQHRNLKAQPSRPVNDSTGSNDQTMNLPAIKELVNKILTLNKYKYNMLINYT